MLKIFCNTLSLSCLAVFSLLAIQLYPSPSQAETSFVTQCVNFEGKKGQVNGDGSCPIGYERKTMLINPLRGTPNQPAGETDIKNILGDILKAVIGVMGGVVLLMFVWGTSGWLLAAGNPEKIQAGAKTMLWAAIGTLVIFISYIFVSVVLSVLGTPTG